MKKTTSNQLIPGMMLSIEGKILRVESAVKVTVPKGTPFIKTKLKDLLNEQLVEKNFKLNQPLDEVSLEERRLEFLYLEGKEYLFLDIDRLEDLMIGTKIIGDKATFLKEGIQVKALFYGDSIFSIELPQFLELMVVRTEGGAGATPSVTQATKTAILETGARIEAPLFIEAGDVIKVDTQTSEYVQRV